MELLVTECLGKPLRLEGSMAGWQQLYWDNQLVAQQNASSDQSENYSHQFQLQGGTQTIDCQLQIKLQWQPFFN